MTGLIITIYRFRSDIIFTYFLFLLITYYLFLLFPRIREFTMRKENRLLLSRFRTRSSNIHAPHVIEVDVMSQARPRDWRGKMSFGERIVAYVTAKLIRILRHYHGVYHGPEPRPIVGAIVDTHLNTRQTTCLGENLFLGAIRPLVR